jgi:hypothetical protein
MQTLRTNGSRGEKQMIKQYRIIVANCHGVESADFWEKRLPPELAAIAPQLRGGHH